MQVRQMSVEDWLAAFSKIDGWYEQVDIIIKRQQRDEPLATWEHNCLRAYERLRQQKAA